MSKTLEFKVFCFEAYRAEKKLTGYEAMELFKKHDVYVISDEIWSDPLLYKNRHNTCN